MDVYVYGDESGTFDPAHNALYTFGGLLLLGKEQKDEAIRQYRAVEQRIASFYPPGTELKASTVDLNHKMALFRAIRGFGRFACIIEQNRVDPRIAANKKSRQRFLDFAFRTTLRQHIEFLVEDGTLSDGELSDLLVIFDEHKTATNGRYELQESIAMEFKDGVISHDGNFFEPAFPHMGEVKTRFVDSKCETLIRASDIIANVMLHKALEGKLDQVTREDVFVTKLP